MCKDISSIIFDVDKTLCSVNCGDRLIRYMIAREHFSFVRLFAMYSNYFIYRLGLLNRNDGVRLSHQVYRGFNLKELDDIADECFERIIKDRLFVEALEEVENYKSQSKKIYLASGSPSIIVDKICKFLEVESCVATEYKVTDGIITGVLDPICFGDGKVETLRRRELLSKPIAVFTDDISDLPLIKAASYVYLVNPNKKLIRTVKSLDIPFEVKRWLHTRHA